MLLLVSFVTDYLFSLSRFKRILPITPPTTHRHCFSYALGGKVKGPSRSPELLQGSCQCDGTALSPNRKKKRYIFLSHPTNGRFRPVWFMVTPPGSKGFRSPRLAAHLPGSFFNLAHRKHHCWIVARRRPPEPPSFPEPNEIRAL